MSEQPRIFVSHATEDGVFSDKLVVALRAAGADVWYAEHNFPQGRIRETIERELLARKVLILVLSPSALASKWVRDETEWFYDLLQEDPARIVVPVLAHPISPTELWLFIRQFKRIETDDGKPFPEDAAIKLTLAALNLTNQPPNRAVGQPRQPGPPTTSTMVVRFEDGTTEEFESKPSGGGVDLDNYRSTDGMYIFAACKDVRTDGPHLEGVVRRLAPVAEGVHGDPYWREIFAAIPDKVAYVPRVGYRMRRIFGSGWRRMDAQMYSFLAYREDLKPYERITFPNRLQAAIQIAAGIDYLESNGIIHSDICHRNFMVNQSGAASLIALDSTLRVGETPIVEGTGTYRAPEIISRRAAYPTMVSARYALAVLLYRWFLDPHPVEGDHPPFDLDPTVDDKLRFGDRALYIEHPTDRSNARKTQILKSNMLGSDLENIFRRAFVDGLHEPTRRPSPREFVIALHRAADLVIPCGKPDCDWHAFVAEPTAPPTCPSCGTAYRQTETLAYLRISGARQTIAAGEHKALVGWHVRSGITPIHRSPADAAHAKPQAMFEYSRQNDQWMLCNLALPEMASSFPGSHESWQAWPVGVVRPLIHDMRIRFGPEPEYHQATCTVVNTTA